MNICTFFQFGDEDFDNMGDDDFEEYSKDLNQYRKTKDRGRGKLENESSHFPFPHPSSSTASSRPVSTPLQAVVCPTYTILLYNIKLYSL